jgi:hypothetical protein
MDGGMKDGGREGWDGRREGEVEGGREGEMECKDVREREGERERWRVSGWERE